MQGRVGAEYRVENVYGLRLAVHFTADGGGRVEEGSMKGGQEDTPLRPSHRALNPTLLAHLVHEAVESLSGVSAATKAVLGGWRGGGEEGGSVRPPKQSWEEGEGEEGGVSAAAKGSSIEAH